MSKAAKGKKDSQRINGIRDEIFKKLKGIKVNVYELGKLLTEAKGLVEPRKFQAWIEETFSGDLSYDSANLYRNIYMKFKDNPKVVHELPLTMLMLTMRKDFPKELLEQIEENPEDFKDVSVKKVRATIGQSQAKTDGDAEETSKAEPKTDQKTAGSNGGNGTDRMKALRHSVAEVIKLVQEVLDDSRPLKRDNKFMEEVGVAIQALDEFRDWVLKGVRVPIKSPTDDFLEHAQPVH